MPKGIGVGAFASISNTFEYAPDCIDLLSNKLGVKVKARSIAPGMERLDLTDPSIKGEGLNWGIFMIQKGDECYLILCKIVSK